MTNDLHLPLKVPVILASQGGPEDLHYPTIIPDIGHYKVKSLHNYTMNLQVCQEIQLCQAHLAHHLSLGYQSHPAGKYYKLHTVTHKYTLQLLSPASGLVRKVLITSLTYVQ